MERMGERFAGNRPLIARRSTHNPALDSPGKKRDYMTNLFNPPAYLLLA
jgi:hypothetical protein